MPTTTPNVLRNALLRGKESIHVVVVDQHELFRLGVVNSLDAHSEIKVVSEANSGWSAMEAIRRLRPQVVVSDLQMDNGDGCWLCHAIEREKLGANMVMLTNFGGEFDVLNCVRAGAKGFLCKGATKYDLVAAVQHASAGRQYHSREAAAKLACVLQSDHLTGRETEILTHVAEGLANKQIASELNITEGTVKTHLNHMMAKLGVSGRTAAVVTAFRRGIIRL